MANNTDLNLHRTIINGLLSISLDNKVCLYDFRNLLKDELYRLDNNLIRIPITNMFRYMMKIRISLIRTFVTWLDLRIACLPNYNYE